MENRLVTNSLQRLGEESAYRQIPKLNEVILAAPDVDANTFKELIAPQILKASSRVTIYTSSTDRALQASELIHQGPRLGLGGDDLISFPNYPLIQVVDATGLDLGVLTLGHSAYGDELLGDISNALEGRDPKQRDLKPHLTQAAWQIATPAENTKTTSAILTAYTEDREENPIKPSLWSRLVFWK
jgi:esterase/lipase superfamily enzyme